MSGLDNFEQKKLDFSNCKKKLHLFICNINNKVCMLKGSGGGGRERKQLSEENSKFLRKGKRKEKGEERTHTKGKIIQLTISLWQGHF